MKNVIEFTIKNLDLRINKAEMSLQWNTLSLKNSSKSDKLDEIKENIKKSKKNIKGYKSAQDCLRNNGNITKSKAEYIMKGLKIRKKILNENLEHCTKTIAHEERALITKEDTVTYSGGIGIAMKHYDDVSISVIKGCKERVAKISNSLQLCESAIEFFGNYLK